MKRRKVLQTLAVASAAPLLSQTALKADPATAAAAPASAFSPHQFATLSERLRAYNPSRRRIRRRNRGQSTRTDRTAGT